ncbi:Putative membrane RDD family protein [Wolbachia endosymbiont of Drosophila simulans wNo]|uniref:RDD family protein n=1 Tax=unclassified Wolbachia TaxID=2640676 RepID=UPI0002D25144|nr:MULTISPECIES: RDD family protein [unclassified Wolbachia]AGJ99325.1 Putative membrane RDD family protein [Wolbachia endosymbiont of Drosophila simulans wNo]QCB62744.1 RDD family protein [Wolbachia endosymbiont of Drosophila mauritiana]QCB63789.1 RDD family protein [Wolbachia endosymbiont of Drosophila mauritiana]QWE33950.1 RDD family protein [Wolbachia endosymbiont of Drosophila simulans]TGB07870.1 RDD family protein [Wolbachia endosymbiont of Drosophila mauritiana]
MLHKFFNRLFSILSSINAIQRVKKDENGICYVTGLRRYLSVLFDLIIIVLFLQFCGQALNQLFMSSESSKILGQIASKYQMQVPLSAEETAMQSKLIKLLILNQIVQFIMLVSYVAYMWIRFGATPGKLLLGLRVVSAQTFEKLTLKQAIKRFFSFILSTAPLFLGFIWSNFDKRCQTWHDKIAGTVVVTNKSPKLSRVD